MNKRIKQLKIQACKWASENASSAEYENAADRKFAELIVRECMGVNSTLLGHNTCKNLHNLYEEHFGVEE